LRRLVLVFLLRCLVLLQLALIGPAVAADIARCSVVAWAVSAALLPDTWLFKLAVAACSAGVE